VSGEPIPLPGQLLRSALIRFCQALAAGGAGEVATHIGSAIETGRLDAGSLLTASLARDQSAVRVGRDAHGPRARSDVARRRIGGGTGRARIAADAVHGRAGRSPRRRACRMESGVLPGVRLVGRTR